MQQNGVWKCLISKGNNKRGAGSMRERMHYVVLSVLGMIGLALILCSTLLALG